MSDDAIKIDERSIGRNDRVAGVLGSRGSTFTLAWLASHRDRLRTLILGGHRLSVLIIWDRKGRTPTERSDADMEAIYQLTYGDTGPPAQPFTEPPDDIAADEEQRS